MNFYNGFPTLAVSTNSSEFCNQKKTPQVNKVFSFLKEQLCNCCSSACGPIFSAADCEDFNNSSPTKKASNSTSVGKRKDL